MKAKHLFAGIAITLIILTSGGLLTDLLFKSYKETFLCNETTCSEDSRICRTPMCKSIAKEFLNWMNRSVDPCDDFYEFMCGNFPINYPLSENKTRRDAFSMLNEKIFNRLKGLLEEDIKEDDFIFVKAVKKQYSNCLDTEKNDKPNLNALNDLLKSLGGWPLISGENWTAPKNGFSEFIGQLSLLGFRNGILAIGIELDPAYRNKILISIGQPIPLSYQAIYNRTAEDDERDIQTERLIQGIAEILSNETVNKADVKEIVQMSNELKQIALHLRQLQNPIRMYNKKTVQELNEITNGTIDWNVLLKAKFGIFQIVNLNDTVLVEEIRYIRQLSSVLKKYKNSTIFNYIFWTIISPLIKHLSSSAVQLQNLYFKETRDLEVPARWTYCVEYLKEIAESVLLRMYIDRFLDRGIKNFTTEFIHQYIDIFGEMINNSTWLGNKPKKEALKKAENMKIFFGLSESLFDNEEMTKAFERRRFQNGTLSNILEDKLLLLSLIHLNTFKGSSNFLKSMATFLLAVEASYSRQQNSINVAAVFLIEPFFDRNLLMAINFGALGSIIGHEIGHAFDSYGRFYDSNGVLKLWWDLDSLKQYDSKKKCYVSQYNRFCPVEWKNKARTCIDGLNTVGENIADDMGLKASFAAYKKWLTRNRKEKRLPGLEEYSSEQLLFMSFGHDRCENVRAKRHYAEYANDEHSPLKYRVTGPIENSEDFHQIFGCQKKKELSACNIW